MRICPEHVVPIPKQVYGGRHEARASGLLRLSGLVLLWFALVCVRPGASAADPSLASAAAAPPPIRFRGDWPGFNTGPTHDVFVVNDLAYVALENGGVVFMAIHALCQA